MPRPRRIDDYPREKAMAPTASPMIACPGWQPGTSCGVAIRQALGICGRCRGEAATAARGVDPLPPIELDAPDLATLPPPRAEPPVSVERTPAPPPPPPARVRMAMQVQKLHWAPHLPCGNMGKDLTPLHAETEDAVTCGRCKRKLDAERRV